MISKKRREGNDGHNMSIMMKISSSVRESDSYEKDTKIEEILEGSGKSKRKMATRKAFDNSRMSRALMDAYRRYCLIDADESETEEFRHNGNVKVLSEEEKKEYIKKRNIERLMEMRGSKK